MCFPRHPECLHWNRWNLDTTLVVRVVVSYICSHSCPGPGWQVILHLCFVHTLATLPGAGNMIAFPQQIKPVRLRADCGCNRVVQPHVATRRCKTGGRYKSARRRRPQDIQKRSRRDNWRAFFEPERRKKASETKKARASERQRELFRWQSSFAGANTSQDWLKTLTSIYNDGNIAMDVGIIRVGNNEEKRKACSSTHWSSAAQKDRGAGSRKLVKFFIKTNPLTFKVQL